MNNITVVVDADAIIAQANPNDILHNRAVLVSQRLTQMNAQMLYPVTAIAEAATHMQRVLNSNASAYGTISLFTEPNVHVVEVNQQTLSLALHYFNPTTSKKNTVFDCVVAAIAEDKQADAIFSFDKFYKKQGFTLAEELK
jgi:predicted nucleic acid-binding protein